MADEPLRVPDWTRLEETPTQDLLDELSTRTVTTLVVWESRDGVADLWFSGDTVSAANGLATYACRSLFDYLSGEDVE